MPYNTRRKSLSLPSLGIQLPHSSRAHRPNPKSTPSEVSQPATKKIKRSHADDEPPSPVSSPRSKTGSPAAVEVPTKVSQPRRGGAEHTPPPSPRATPIRKIDTDGINDDIVIAVIEQLEKTGNRPHLIRDLAAILASSNQNIAHSANPAALLSSRLSLYLKRPWTALSPCPLAKELIPVHPRKVFFFLTGQPRMSLPQSSDDIISPSSNQIKRLTPSISDPSVVEDDMDVDTHDRLRMSPSPEVELFSPDLEQGSSMAPPTPAEAFSGRSSLNPDGTTEIRRRPNNNNRAPSPSLEADERGFTETATAVRARGMSLHDPPVLATVEVEETTRPVEISEETAEQGQKRDQELGFALFGRAHSSDVKNAFNSSPLIQPRQDPQPVSHTKMNSLNLHRQLDDMEIGDSLNVPSPESIEVEDLDMLFSDF